MLKIINRILVVMMMLGTGVIVYLDISSGIYGRIIVYLSILLVILIPWILNKTKFKLNEKQELIFLIFMFIADFFGGIVNLYKYTSWFDVFAHYSFGLVGFLMAIFILIKLGEYDSNKTFFNLLFIFGIIGMCASLWEIAEFSVDCFAGTNLQYNLETGVRDTMEDIIVAFLGGLTILPFYLIKIKKRKKNA